MTLKVGSLDRPQPDPLKGVDTGLMKTVVCRFTEEDFEWIKNQAKRRKVSFACIVRESVKLGRQWELNRWI